MAYQTPTPRAKDIKRSWHAVDVGGRVLGRVAVDIATKLMGKHKVYFVPHLDCGDHVVVTNSSRVAVTGRKAQTKQYTRYSGYPGGLRTENFESLRKRRPEEIIRHAVYGMLPKNKLRNQMIKRLYVYPDAHHPYTDKLNT